MWKRQDGPIGGNGNNEDNSTGYGYRGYDNGGENWWWSPTGMAVRYAIVAVLFGAILLFFVGGYYHAQSRLRKGLEPLPYHRWMIRRTYYSPSHPRYYNQYPVYAHQQQQNSYGMDGYPPPPPAYNSAEAPPPVYQPPPGATKAMADQSWREEARVGEGSGSSGVPAAPPPAAGGTSREV